MRIIPFAIASLAMGLAGCASPTSPVTAANPAPTISAGQVATLGAGTAAGAYIGDQIGGTKGAIIGGAAGLVGTALVSNAVEKASSDAIGKAAEEACRKERLKIMQDYWYDKTLSAGEQSAGTSHPAPLLDYPAGTYSGVNFGPRVASDSSLSEPNR
jgi:hypothetical protein